MEAYISEKFSRVLSYFPIRLSSVIKSAAEAAGGCDEIRLTVGSPASVLTAGSVTVCDTTVTRDDMLKTVRVLCGNSLYSHTETIKEGYVVTQDGVRASLAGRAVTEGGKIVAVTDFSSVIIRLPSRVPHFADVLYEEMKKDSFRSSVLVWSPPYGGKTTLLRELVHKLSTDEPSLKVAVVDTRYEICDGLYGDRIIAYSGYPRAKGMEIAVRTSSPDVVVCDEVWRGEDEEAIEYARRTGAAVVASCHASSAADAKARCGEFDIYYGVAKDGDGAVLRTRA